MVEKLVSDPFYKKLNMYLDGQSKMFYSLFLLYIRVDKVR